MGQQGADTRAAPPGPRFQATLAGPISGSGVGLHTAKPSNVRVLPAPPDHGVVFRRFVQGVAHDVPAHWRNRRSRPLCTALQVGEGPLVRTVEHLMAALSAARIDNALVEIDAEELPIFDGSAEPWRLRLAEAGRVEQDRPRRYLRVLKRVEYRNGRHKQSIDPAAAFTVKGSVTLNGLGQLRWSGPIDPDTFARELAPSRSFGRLKWALFAKLFGRFTREPVLRGANLSNTVALWRRSAIGGLRMPDEPVRHRVLDLVGDYALAGHPLMGRTTAVMPGHEHNHAMIAILLEDVTAWDLVEIAEGGDLRPVA